MATADGDVNLKDVCSLLGIGNPQSSPKPVKGGLLHRMWRLETEKGTFAVKVLNPEIMSRPDAKQNYRISERVAKIANHNGIRAVIAKTVSDDPWIEINSKHVMVFDWVDGHTPLSEECTSEHARRIGKVLSQLHNLDIVIDGLELPTFSTVAEDTWKGHIEKARRVISCWGFQCETLLHDVSNWSRLYQDAVDKLSQQLVISHRDLDSKNVIWTSAKTPHLIDWESAGYVNPMVELIEAALNWSRNQDGTSDKERFQTVIRSYGRAGGTLYGKVLDAVYGALGGRLGWLEYNMHRSLDADVFRSDDRELGQREVKKAIHELGKLNDGVFDYAQWVEEIYG